MKPFCADHQPADPVAIGADGALCCDEFLRRAALIAKLLPEPRAGSHVALLFGVDRAACAAAILAAWARGHAVALPADTRRESVAPVIEREEVVEILHDTGIGRGIDVPRLLQEAPAGTPLPPVGLAPDGTVLSEGRVGADGSVRMVAWSGAGLGRLLDQLATRIELPGDSMVVTTLTPTYPPGVFLSLLLPLVQGVPFASRTLLAPAPRQPAEIGGGRPVSLLVSAPAHLRGLADFPAGELARVRRIVSATGAPDDWTVQTLRERHGLEVGMPLLAAERRGTDLPGQAAERLTAALLEMDEVEDAIVVEARDGAAGACRYRAAVTIRPALARVEDGLAAIRGRLLGDASSSESLEIRPVTALPRDPNGGLRPDRVFALFGLGADGAGRSRSLHWEALDEQQQDGVTEHRFRTRIPPDYLFFEGHFPTYPVLAGAVQIHELVLPCLRRCMPRAGALTRLSGLKFPARIGPGDQLEVVLSHRAGSADIRFLIRREQTVCTNGTLRVENRAGEGGA